MRKEIGAMKKLGKGLYEMTVNGKTYTIEKFESSMAWHRGWMAYTSPSAKATPLRATRKETVADILNRHHIKEV